jgi:uncharacterized membrane protein
MRRLVLVLLLAACSNAPDQPELPPEEEACAPESSLTWQSFGEPFLLDHCTGCHSSKLAEGFRGGAPVGVDFNTHEQTLMWLERIAARSADDNKTMPPVDTVSEEARVLLGDWIACGAP